MLKTDDWNSLAMLAALLTTFLWAASAVCGSRSARLVGGTEANFWRLLCATVMLGCWAHLFGQGLGGVALPLFLWSGIIGVGADMFLFQSYPRLGARLTILIIQCGAALVGAVVEWLWQGTQLTLWQIVAGATILGGVALALAPGKHLSATPRELRAGIAFSALGAFGNGFGAVLSRRAFAVAREARQNIDAPTAAYQRLVEERRLDPARTWMVGNSPKSDINPAMEAGLNAVFIPHAHTWVLEKQEIRPGAGQLLALEEFRELRRYF